MLRGFQQYVDFCKVHKKSQMLTVENVKKRLIYFRNILTTFLGKSR